LDGQQRITTLYGIMRGEPPKFFDGNLQAFTGLYFNLDDEVFEFYAPLKMKNNPRWINVTELMQIGAGEAIQRLFANQELRSNLNIYINRLNAIDGIKNIELHVEKVTGDDKSSDVVVEIFNRVNSGGTKLSKGDLALAKICASWPEARQEMKASISRWKQAGFDFNLDWLLRNITTILTDQAMFSALKDIDTLTFQNGLKQAEMTCNYLLNMISGRLGLDHDRVLGGRYAFPVMTCYLARTGGKLQDARQRDKILYWYIHSFLSGRFTGSTETALNQDLRMLDDTANAIDHLIGQLRLSRRDLYIRPEDFAVSSLGARYYPMLYMLTRVCDARDWGDGLPLSANLLGRVNALQVHHIFPKALLYKHNYRQSDVNAIANFCFLTQGTNLDISAKKPAIYFKKIEEDFPGALASQWIPMDSNLWEVERYQDFLVERRKLLAGAANKFLDTLLTATPASVDYSTEVPQITTIVSGEDEDELQALISWSIASGFPKPELNFDVCDPISGEVLATVDVAWPRGLQEGYSQPIALLLGEEEQNIAGLNQVGYRFFINIETLRRYLENNVDTSNLEEFTLTYTLTGHSKEVWSVAISANGQTLVSGSGDRTIKMWNVNTGQLLHTFQGHSARVFSTAISPDEKILVSGSGDGIIKVWNLRTRQLLRTLTGHSKEVWSVAISANGQTLVSGSADKTVKIWDLNTGQLLHTLTGNAGYVLSVLVSPDGKTLIHGSCQEDNSIKVWDLQTGQLLRTLKGHSIAVNSLAISADGQTLVSGGTDKVVKIWDLNTGQLLHTFTGPSLKVNSVAISADRQTLASGSSDRTIKLWNPHTKQLICILTGHSKEVWSVAVSRDGQTLVSGSGDQTIKVWRKQ
jgi:WD40 repeat protein